MQFSIIYAVIIIITFVIAIIVTTKNYKELTKKVDRYVTDVVEPTLNSMIPDLEYMPTVPGEYRRIILGKYEQYGMYYNETYKTLSDYISTSKNHFETFILRTVRDDSDRAGYPMFHGTMMYFETNTGLNDNDIIKISVRVPYMLSTRPLTVDKSRTLNLNEYKTGVDKFDRSYCITSTSFELVNNIITDYVIDKLIWFRQVYGDFSVCIIKNCIFLTILNKNAISLIEAPYNFSVDHVADRIKFIKKIPNDLMFVISKSKERNDVIFK